MNDYSALPIIKNREQLVQRFCDRNIVTIAAGTTCAFLGDERNLREFVIADEAAKVLRRQGHVVHTLLFDDNLDPLTEAQLRLAVNKDCQLAERFAEFCGKPIASVPDPWECHATLADHFEEALLDRLTTLGCQPNVISTASLYQRGVYSHAVELVIERHLEILEFLGSRFRDYAPQALIYPICPMCGHIAGTRLEMKDSEWLSVACASCRDTHEVHRVQLRAKLSWKLDCAVRWAMFGIDAELFNKAYLEPSAGTYVVAQALGSRFFGCPEVAPVQYGIVTIGRDVSFKLIRSLPGPVLRTLLASHWPSEISITRERVVLEASRIQVLPGLSYLDVVRQLLPGWMLDPTTLPPERIELFVKGGAFASEYLGGADRLRLPVSSTIDRLERTVAKDLLELLDAVMDMRAKCTTYVEFEESVRLVLKRDKSATKGIAVALRHITGLERSLPMKKLLYHLPKDYLSCLAYVLRAHLRAGSTEALPRAA